MKATGSGKRPVQFRVNVGLFQDHRWKAAAIQPRNEVGGSLFQNVPIAGCIGSKQLVPGGLGVHSFSFR